MGQQADDSANQNPAALYESFFVQAIHGPFAEILIDRVLPRPGDRVLDVGCGTGAVARRVAGRLGADGSVTGLELSSNMLNVARSLPLAGAAVEWVEGDAAKLPFPDGHFDLVVCQQSLQFFPDRASSVMEMHRVLVPGGRLGLSVWASTEHQTLMRLIDQAIERHLGSLPEAVSPFSLGNPDELRDLVTGAGFHDVRIESVSAPVRFSQPDQFAELTIGAAASVLPEYEEMDGPTRDSMIAAIKHDLAQPIADHLEEGILVFPMTTHIVTAVAWRPAVVPVG